jgi:hypothetical protein
MENSISIFTAHKCFDIRRDVNAGVGDAPECVTTCVAAAGQWCGVEGEDAAEAAGAGWTQVKTQNTGDPVLIVFECHQGFYCPGGRGEGKYPCEVFHPHLDACMHVRACT